MRRDEVINSLIEVSGAESYLEIGVAGGDTFSQILCKQKVGVDPSPIALQATHIQTSDEFFAQNTETFDLIFIDGLHHRDQVRQDIINSLKVLRTGGFIVCHDMNPTNERMQLVPMADLEWTGDCWKAWVELRWERPDLEMFVVNTDYGCGVITWGKQHLLTVDPALLTWNNLCLHRKEWLNLISVEEFQSVLDGSFEVK